MNPVALIWTVMISSENVTVELGAKFELPGPPQKGMTIVSRGAELYVPECKIWMDLDEMAYRVHESIVTDADSVVCCADRYLKNGFRTKGRSASADTIFAICNSLVSLLHNLRSIYGSVPGLKENFDASLSHIEEAISPLKAGNSLLDNYDNCRLELDRLMGKEELDAVDAERVNAVTKSLKIISDKLFPSK